MRVPARSRVVCNVGRLSVSVLMQTPKSECELAARLLAAKTRLLPTFRAIILTSRSKRTLVMSVTVISGGEVSSKHFELTPPPDHEHAPEEPGEQVDFGTPCSLRGAPMEQ